MFSSQRRTRAGINIWPGFVDVLATVLLTFVFVILLFVIGQFYLSGQLSDRDAALARLETRIQQLADELSLERGTRARLEERISDLYEELHATLSQRDELRRELTLSEEQAASLRAELANLEQQLEVSEETLSLKLRELASLQADIAALREVRDELEAEVAGLATALQGAQRELGQIRDRNKALRAELADAEERTMLAQETIEDQDIRIESLIAQVEERDRALHEQTQLTTDATARLEAMQRQMEALREQIAALSEALDVSQQTVSAQRAEIENLGERLNVALAKKVRELASYRSEFFGRLRQVLGDMEQIRIVGDRFMFQSELFFDTASAEIGPEGRRKLDQLADVLMEVAQRIPDDVPWVLMVEGHTDTRPISTEQFPSNWELSTARATNIVHYLIDQGVPAERLAAAGFGEYQPLVAGNTPEAYARNRRIELRLTSR
jgi:chemotaxis protein MotB